MPGWARFLAFLALTLAVGALVRLTGVAPLIVAAIATVAWFVLRFVVRRFDDVAPPAEPRRGTARLPHVRAEPPRTIPDLADACEICGRKLTAPESRRARVGTDCIKTHGPRPRDQANPDHDRWNTEMARARAVQAERQVALNRAHDKAMVVHQAELTAWAVDVSTPEGAARHRARRRIKTTRSLVGITVWVAVAGHFATL